MTDNRTTELRAKLMEHGVEYEADDHKNYAYTYWGDWAYCEPLDAKPGTLGAQCELMLIPATPEQAIAVTLGEKPRDKTEEWLLNACNQATRDYVAQLEQERDELKQLVRDLIPFVCADDGIEGIETRMKELGIEVIDE